MTKSVLDDVPGLGPTRRTRLLKEFGSVKRLREHDRTKSCVALPWLPGPRRRRASTRSSTATAARRRPKVGTTDEMNGDRPSTSPSSPACPAPAVPPRPTCSRTSASSSSTTCRPRSSARSPSSARGARRPAALRPRRRRPLGRVRRRPRRRARRAARHRARRTRVLFLDASDDVLVRRYEASRRRHPLAVDDRVSRGHRRTSGRCSRS